MTSLSECMRLCRSQRVRQLHVLCFKTNKMMPGRCHRCPFNHWSCLFLSLALSCSICHPSIRGTFSHNALCSRTYWQVKILAAVQSCVCMRVCADPKHFCSFKMSCWLKECIPSVFICQDSLPASFHLLLLPDLVNCCDTVALESLVLKYSCLMTNEHVDRFLSLAGH